MSKLKVVFDAPTHGWLPVRRTVAVTEVDFVASRVPNDPVETLIDALLHACDGLEATVRWNLEPAGAVFEFSPIDGRIQLRVLFTDHRGGERREVVSLRGSRQEILLPFWRALRRLQSSGPTPHWPALPAEPLARLGERLRAAPVSDGG